ncbi:SH3 domain-containing C40 family peptidase [Pseudoflavonifractor phocaeensis]|uniref:C40 family peptidase n=1 Tax=Pseudoflavonifractor phocaeensis TaxID=1870988 RepID=UPI00313CAC5C
MEAVVSTPRCPLYLRPSAQSELADEALLGWTVTILDNPCPGWYQVRTDYGYTGYAPAGALTVGDGNARRWAGLEKKTVCRAIASVRSRPNVQGWQVEELLRGAWVAVHGDPDGDGWQKISLPDGREGFTKTGFLRPMPAAPLTEAAFRQAVTHNAGLYLGTHYLWGGKTPMGIDCSGLTFMAYRLAGAAIWRDASIKEGYPLHAIDPADKKPGDLMFFPGHVAMYLGQGRYIHSTAFNGSDGVVINSLDPAQADYRPDLPEKLTAVGSLF